jgi:peptide deformylase
MSDLYDIIITPDPVLKAEAQEVSTVDDALRGQMDKMLATMYDAPGIGLAANQVGLLNRVLVMDLSNREEEEKAEPICMVNPQIIHESEEPSVMQDVERPALVRVKYLDYNGKEAELEATGLLSHCVQHEIDHLNGVLFIDYLSSLKRNMILRKVEKLKKQMIL